MGNRAERATHIDARLRELIDLDRYPIDLPQSTRLGDVVDKARRGLAEVGAAELVGFLRPEGIAACAANAESVRVAAFRTDHRHDIEFSGIDPQTMTADDPRRISVRSAKFGTAHDKISDDSPLRALFESPALTQFIGAIVEADPLYPMADPLGALNVMFYGPGDELGWHFDNAEFAVTIMIQPSSGGGQFEFVPMLRSETERNDDGVRALLERTPIDLHTMGGAAGTLALFRGHLSPHRVTPIVGSVERINAVLAYSRRPDHFMSAHGQQLFYGRTVAPS